VSFSGALWCVFWVKNQREKSNAVFGGMKKESFDGC